MDYNIKLFLVNVFLISLPQNIALTIGIYAFNREKIHSKKFWKCTLISFPIIFLIRLSPIDFGVHTLLGMVLLIFLSVYVLDFPIHKTIKSVLFTVIIILIVEILNIIVFTLIFGSEKFKEMMTVNLTKALAGFPASILIFIIISIFYYFLTKKVAKDCDKDEERIDSNI